MTLEKSTPKRSADKSGFTLYFLVLFSIPILLYPLPFFLLRLPSFESLSRTFDFRPLNYAFKNAGQDAEIVIYGDSSAYQGINPSQIAVQLGKKVINLPNNLSGLIVDDDLPLRRYLQTNQPPQLIIFYFSPWDFDYGHADFDKSEKYDGVEMLLRHGTASDILSLMRLHPLLAADFPLMFYAANLGANDFKGAVFHKQSLQLEATHGHVDTVGEPHLSYSCAIPSELIDGIRFDWVRALGAKYRSPHTQVMFFVAPIPSCSNAGDVLHHPFSTLPAAPPKLMPPPFFVQDKFYVHPYPVAVPQVTQSLIDSIRPLLSPSNP